MRAMRSRRIRHAAWTMTLVLTMGSVLTGSMHSASAVEAGFITSAGPLTELRTTPDLNCAVRHALDNSPEFYGTIACGTFVAVDGQLFGPAYVPAGSSAAPRTAFTPVSQSVPGGTGTAADPYRVVTTVDLGTTGIRLIQTDLYVSGQESYSTDVELRSTAGSTMNALVYRAGDCYLANSDIGKGSRQGDQVACVSADGRVEQWIPITEGSQSYEAQFSEVWARIGAQQPFPNTCRCDESIDNGAGLSWFVRVPAAGSARVKHLTAFASARDNLDRDGDGLLDVWETRGLDLNGDGTLEVDLPAMGASPDHRDIFVEVDWMNRPATCIWVICWGGRNFAPQAEALTDVRNAFAAAPVSNPDGTQGVRMHIDSGPAAVMNPVTGETWGNRSRAGQVAHSAQLGSFSGDNYNWGPFNVLKSANFEAARADVFHYALFADTYGGSGSSGIAQGLPGDSFLVTDGAAGWGSGGFSRRQESGTFMHELGHTLNLHHGGGGGDDGRDIHYKPNYLSIMNYSWQLGGRPLDYSRSALPTLDESALSEQAGLGTAAPVVKRFCANGSEIVAAAGPNTDWNCNGTTDPGTVASSVNRDSARDTLRGYQDWPNLVYDGGTVGAFGVDDLNDQAPPPEMTPADELTVEELRDAHSLGGDGDGSVAVTGPGVLFRDLAGQRISVEVTNVGDEPATYRLAADLEAQELPGSQVIVPADATRRFEIPIDPAVLSAGQMTLNVRLLHGVDGSVLSRATAAVAVPDLSTASNRQAASEALDRLSADQPGLDPVVRGQVESALRSALDQVGPQPSPSPSPSTAPEVPTCTISGTEGSDVLQGTEGADVICGKGGNDTIRGLGGDDIIRGGNGKDTIYGGAGNDLVDGGDADDMIKGEAGNDSIIGGFGADTISGGLGDDTVDGRDANDVLNGDAGNDFLVGGFGDDRINGGDGNDQIDGRDGKDLLNGDAGDDTLAGALGDDRMSGGDGNDRVNGGDGADTVTGDVGDDIIEGGNGDDRLYGNAGNDRLHGGSGKDVLDGGEGTNVIVQ